MKNHDRYIQLLVLRKARWDAEESRLKMQRMQMEFRPSLYMPTIIRREGTHWLCIHPSDEDDMACPMAYGDSPHQAMVNFDLLWLGAGIKMDPPADGEETELEEF